MSLTLTSPHTAEKRLLAILCGGRCQAATVVANGSGLAAIFSACYGRRGPYLETHFRFESLFQPLSPRWVNRILYGRLSLGPKMRRREFLNVLWGPPAAWPPFWLIAQGRPIVARVGILHPGSPPDPWLDGLRGGLRELGYIEGKDLVLEYRWAEGRSERLPDLADALIASKVDIIVIMTGPAVLAAKNRTKTLPIVMAVSGDPVGTGAVSSLARPGGNVTGLSLMSDELAGRRLSLLKETVPSATRVGVLYNPTEPPTKVEMRALSCWWSRRCR